MKKIVSPAFKLFLSSRQNLNNGVRYRGLKIIINSAQKQIITKFIYIFDLAKTWAPQTSFNSASCARWFSWLPYFSERAPQLIYRLLQSSLSGHVALLTPHHVFVTTRVNFLLHSLKKIRIILYIIFAIINQNQNLFYFTSWDCNISTDGGIQLH